MTPLALVKAIRQETSDERGELLLNLYLSGRRPRLVVVGDAPAEEAQYDRTLDVVQEIVGADRG